MKVSWRTIGTVLLEEELLDKAFSRAKKAADRVDDPDRVFRVRKQMTRMVQTRCRHHRHGVPRTCGSLAVP